MERLISAGRLLFGIALLGLGIEHFIYQDFIVGRAPAWPASLPGKLIWAYLTGVFLIAVALAVITGKMARVALVSSSFLILVWALVRHIPVVISSSLLSGEWTSAGKALTFIGGALVVATTFPKIDSNYVASGFINKQHEFITAGRICLGIFLVICGIQHFMYVAFVITLIPAWFPGDATFWTKFAGIALIAGGIGLFIPKTAGLAALLSGLMVFLWFWIVHLPRVNVSVSDNIAVFEALAVAGIGFVMGRYLSRPPT